MGLGSSWTARTRGSRSTAVVLTINLSLSRVLVTRAIFEVCLCGGLSAAVRARAGATPERGDPNSVILRIAAPGLSMLVRRIFAVLLALTFGCIPYGDAWLMFSGKVRDERAIPIDGARIEIVID